ncbi:MAG: PhoX family protein [Acidobacteria bacterium]|nr:PhoX family protein [Acidobacteriota bacterium]
MSTPLNRRSFLHHALLAGGSMALPLQAFASRVREAGGRVPVADGYGPLGPAADETTGLPLLFLPAGFRYLSFGWTGDVMDDEGRTPGAHDGMAAFDVGNDRALLIRNHELGPGRAFGRGATYDAAASGGTTTLEFDQRAGKWLGARASLAGTIRNCAGGPTPWASWLTCEETVLEAGPDQTLKRPHGYVFEVPLAGSATAEPLEALGRFVHEAIAIDPATGIVYETEDARRAGFYRFLPSTRGDLARGGRLEMLAVAGKPQFDTRTGVRTGAVLPVAWVPIEHPNRAHEAAGVVGGGVFAQGLAHGAATFARLEGASAGAGKIVFTATSGGETEMGQVWEYDPARDVLRLIYESPGKDVLNMPDNVCLSPRGGLVICEDGTENPSIHGLTRGGELFRFARNNVVLNGERGGIAGDFRASETAGATFSPDGRWLFFNVQSPGFTVAVTGPWETGLL